MWIERGLRPRRGEGPERGVRRALKLASEDERGFTVLELLVVVIIVGVLAAIAIPILSGQQESAKISNAKSDLINFKTAFMSYGIANGGSFEIARSGNYPTPGILDKYGWVRNSGTADLWLERATKTDFCASALGADGGDVWIITASTPPTKGYC